MISAATMTGRPQVSAGRKAAMINLKPARTPAYTVPDMVLRSRINSVARRGLPGKGVGKSKMKGQIWLSLADSVHLNRSREECDMGRLVVSAFAACGSGNPDSSAADRGARGVHHAVHPATNGDIPFRSVCHLRATWTGE